MLNPNKQQNRRREKNLHHCLFIPSTMLDQLTFSSSVEEGTQNRNRYEYSTTRKQKFCKWIWLLSALAIVILTSVVFWKVIPTSSLWPSSEDSYMNVVHHESFDKQRHVFISEVDADMITYRHKKTNTEILTLIPSDTTQDSTFGISFRTIPNDSTGVAHILEHSVLDGSQKYPSKDPFNALLGGSLQTFLNAFTFADRTAYVVASRNRADFNNLMSVYLDAVFQPKCVLSENSWIFRQEGWRLEQEDDNLSLNGVVMSEMKGAYSNPDELIDRYAQSLLFPDTSYRFDSGGEPLTIPSLEYKKFVEFYTTFYHPTNAKVFLFGPREHIEDGLEQISGYLDEMEENPEVLEASRVEWQAKNYNEPQRQRLDYPSSSNDGDYRVLMSWLLNSQPMDRKEELAWYIINELLLGSSTSVLTKALIDSGHGQDVIGIGAEDGMQQWTFQVGMQGIQEAGDMLLVEEVILKTLEGVVRNGFYQEDLDSAMNTVEFQLRELSTGKYPRGVVLFMNALAKWNYDADPRSLFEFEVALGQLKKNVEQEGFSFFTQLISHGLLDNKHRVVTELHPNSTLEQQHAVDEEGVIGQIQAALTSEQFQELLNESEQLNNIQQTDDSPEALAAIPVLTVNELEANGEEYPISTTRQDDLLVAIHEVQSSYNIVYVDFGLDISMLDLEDVALVPLLARLILESGTSTLDEAALSRQIRMYTGGFDTTPFVDSIQSSDSDEYTVTDGTRLSSKFFVRAKCFSDNASKMFEIMGHILFQGRPFSKDKTIAILKEVIAERQDEVKTRGHHLARHRLEAHYSISGYANELLYGVSGLQKLREVLEEATSNWDSVSRKLEEIRMTMTSGHRNGMVLNLTGDKQVVEATSKAVDKFLGDTIPANEQATPFPDFAAEEHPWTVPAKQAMEQQLSSSEGFVTSTRVSYVGKSGLLYQPTEPVPGSAAVVTQYLANDFLYDNLRLQRGVYGANANLKKRSGMIDFVSYRDPNLAETLDVYDQAKSYLSNQLSASEELSPAAKGVIIGTIGDLDGSAPQPDQVGWDSLRQYLRGETSQQRQTWRKQILSTSRQNYLDFSQRLNALGLENIAVVSSQAMFDEAAQAGKIFTLVDLEQ